MRFSEKPMVISASRLNFPYPSIEAIRTALDMLADEYPQARSVDANEVTDLSFVKQVEGTASR
jgi:hypothetical protein